MQLFLDGRRFQWIFLLVAVQFPIISVDFIRAHHLLVDPSNIRLVDKLTYQSVMTDSDKLQADLGCARPPAAISIPSGSSSPSLHFTTVVSPPLQQPPTPPLSPSSVAQLLDSFPDVVILINSYPRLSMMCSISSRLLGHLCPPDFAGGREPSSRQPGWSLTRWREMASFVTLPVPGPPLLTWWPRRTVPGGLAATSGGSISSQSPTGTHFPTCWTSRIGSMGAALSLRSTCGRAAGRSP